MEASTLGRFLEWDSTFFGLRIGSLTTPALPSALSHGALDEARMQAAIAWCREQSLDCVYLLSDSADLVTLRAAEAQRFKLVDIRMTFEMRVDPGEVARTVASTTARVRASREEDIPALRALAARSHTASRFYSDGRFARDRCDELYATWIEKSCRGWADHVFVAEHEGLPQGYLSVHIRPDANASAAASGTRGEIGIVAVAPDAQGLGLGRQLIDSALMWFAERRVGRVTVVTQGRNTAAQRLYESRGFRSLAVQLWHHRWFDREKDRA